MLSGQGSQCPQTFETFRRISVEDLRKLYSNAAYKGEGFRRGNFMNAYGCYSFTKT